MMDLNNSPFIRFAGTVMLALGLTGCPRQQAPKSALDNSPPSVRPDLSHADLNGMDLNNQNLSGKPMAWAKARGASLRSTDFSRANAAFMDFTEANLVGAKFDGALLRLTRFPGANLSHAEGLTQKMLDEACGDAATVLPDGLTIRPC